MSLVSKPSESLLIGLGCNSALAKVLLPCLPHHNRLLLLSTREGSVECSGRTETMTQYAGTSFDDLESVISSSNLPARSELNKVSVVSFVGIKDDGILIGLGGKQIDKIINVNLALNAYLSSIIIKKYRGVRISFVFMSSAGALAGDRGITIYSATKHALGGLVRGLALEYGKFDVNANVLALGVLPVGMRDSVPTKRLDEMIKRTANQKVVSIENVALSVEFLLQNCDVNGTTLSCDGGYF